MTTRPSLFLLSLCLAGLLFHLSAKAQNNMKDSLRVHMMTPGYSMQLPLGDMSKRFGLSHTIGAGYTYMSKSRWLISAEGNFLFGPNVKNRAGVLAGDYAWITTADGHVINKEGVFSNLAITERGYSIVLKAGKLIPASSRNPNRGLVLQIGGGMLQHKIRIDVSQNDTPQLRDDFKKGYDRLCNGPAIVEYVGYQHLDSDKRINFYGGVEVMQAFTQSRRAYYFAEGIKPDEHRFDMLIGFRIGWIIPFYSKTGREYYYY